MINCNNVFPNNSVLDKIESIKSLKWIHVSLMHVERIEEANAYIGMYEHGAVKRECTHMYYEHD